MNATEATGKKFGRLTVMGLSHVNKHRCWVVLCRCSCGKRDVKVLFTALRAGTTRSCGCLHREVAARMGRRSKTHGHATAKRPSKTYAAWSRMKSRCMNPNHTRYARWGGRGIAVCARWLTSFANFLSDMGVRPRGKSLERKNNDKNYTPGNCTWATPSEQGNNRRSTRRLTFRGRTQSLSQWAKDVGLKRLTLHMRLKRGASLRAALTAPARL